MQRQHEQLELFRRLASTGIIGLVVANREGTITEANAAVLRAVGFSADEVERGELNWDRLLAPPHLERHRQVVETLGTATTGAEASNCARGSAEYNVELLHRSGPSVAARLATARLSGDGDYATCVVFTDGERALREQVAEQSKELRRYEAIAAIWPAPIFAKEYSDDKNGVYILANPVAHAIMGTTEVLGLSDYDFFPPPVAEALQKADRDVIAGGKPVTVQEALPDTRKNGGTAHFMTTKLPLRDSEGKLYASAGLAVDITEPVLLTKRLEALVDALPDTMMRISRDGVIRDGTYKQYSGLGIKTDAATESIEALAASNMRDLPLPEEILDMYSSAITQALESEQLREFEYSIDDCDEPRHFEARVVKSGADEVVAIIRDITEATRTREALRTAIRKLSAANYELKEFAYIASHDLQEPLRTVRNFSELLEQRYRKSLDERGSRWLQRINGNAARMQTLIDDLLMYSGVGRNAARSEVDAGAVVRTLLEDVAAGIHMAGAEITVGELPQVWVNKTELRQVFQNLIVNALKFRRPEVSPRIEIIAEANDDRWQFTVRDNGIGIAPEHQDRIFKVFKRLHDRSEYAGNGIGLALVKKVVTHHGGNITVHSQPGQGSEFRFTLPAVPPRAPSQ